MLRRVYTLTEMCRATATSGADTMQRSTAAHSTAKVLCISLAYAAQRGEDWQWSACHLRTAGHRMAGVMAQACYTARRAAYRHTYGELGTVRAIASDRRAVKAELSQQLGDGALQYRKRARRRTA
jgi:hypothetical protein